MSRFREHDALVWEESLPEDRKKVSYVPKRQQKAKGAEVVFDPAAHK